VDNIANSVNLSKESRIKQTKILGPYHMCSTVVSQMFQCGSDSVSSISSQCGFPESDLGSQTNADPCGSGLSTKKLNCYMENILKVGKRSKNKPMKVQKPFFERQDIRFIYLFIYFLSFSMLLDPYPPTPNRIQDSLIIADQCGPG
jgi:hypothetical protein